MRPASLAGTVLALSTGISAQRSISIDGFSSSTPSSSISNKTGPVSESTSTATTTDLSGVDVNGLVRPLLSNVTSIPSPSTHHVDTVDDTLGVPSTHTVLNAKLLTFCTVSPAHENFCMRLQAFVSVSISTKDNSTYATARRLLAFPIQNGLCKTAPADSVTKIVCQRWWYNANLCNNKTKRGPCAYGHVSYLLRQLRDFLALPEVSDLDDFADEDEDEGEDQGEDQGEENGKRI